MKILKSFVIMAIAFSFSIPATAPAQDEVSKYVGQGEEYFRLGMFDKAVAEFQKALRMDPKNLGAAAGLGKSAMQLQDWVSAKSGYETAQSLSPGDCAVSKNLAYIYLALNLKEKAIQGYEQVVGVGGRPGCDPNDSFSKANLGLLYSRSTQDEQKDKAIQLFNQVINSGQADSSTLYRAHSTLGDLYRQKKSYDLAIEQMEKAFQIMPAKTEGRYNLGNLYFNKQNYEKALEHLKVAYAEQPSDYRTNLMLGKCYSELKMRQDAINHLATAVNLIRLIPDAEKPRKNLPHMELGNLYTKENEPQTAIQVLREGLGLADDASEKAGLTCSLGKAYEKLQKYEQAMEQFESVMDDPQWGSYAIKQIERLETLIEQQEARSGK